MEAIGIEDARKTLGEIANRADLAGQTTYLTRNGRPVAAVVPTLHARYRTGVRRKVDVPEPPSHAIRIDDSGPARTWRCACGMGNMEMHTASVYEQYRTHQSAEARQFLHDMPGEQLGELLRRTTGDNWRTTAAIELLIAHGHWLHDKTLREDYLRAEWSDDGVFEVHVEWPSVALGADLIHRATHVLHAAGVDDDLLAAIQEWDNDGTTGQAPLDGSTSEMAILRLAASIAGGLPVDLFDDTTSLGDTERGWVLTAISHLLTRGGGLTFDAARTWPTAAAG